VSFGYLACHLNRLGEALQAVDDRDQYVLDAAVLELVHDPQPELGGRVRRRGVKSGSI
jgi:hypothetical protein